MSDPTPETDLPTGAFFRLRNYFFTGILVSAPVLITIYIIFIFLDFIDVQMHALMPGIVPKISVPGLGLVVAAIVLVLIGWLATNFLGRLVIKLSEGLFGRTPVVRTLYGGSKQILEMIMGKQAKAFRETVLVEFPCAGVWSIGFLTGNTQADVSRQLGQHTISVYVPTAPNPTSGYVIFVPPEKIKRTSITVDQALKLVVSSGVLVPHDNGPILNTTT
jgi:uncharacterized membrane protein